MSTRWQLVYNRLLPHCCNKQSNLTLKEVFTHLYYDLNLSTSQLASLTKGEASSPTIRNKLRTLGIPIKSRGGANYLKLEDITLTEYLTNTYEELAVKYNVHPGTIERHTKHFRERGYGKLAKVLRASHVSSDTDPLSD